MDKYVNFNGNLPLLPGYIFNDPLKTTHYKTQYFDYKFGVPDPKTDPRSGKHRDINSIKFYNCESLDNNLDPELTYGNKYKQGKPAPPFRPHYVKYDRVCLKFQGYFSQLAFNTPDESYRIRIVDLLYFLEDDTVSVIEPKVPNSGLSQGRLVRRSRIPMGPLPDCDYLHWKDMNIGNEYNICGYGIRIVDCDAFTRQFMESQGCELHAAEPIPADDYTKKGLQPSTQRPPACHSPSQLNLKHLRQYDGVILKFRAIWNGDGAVNNYGLCYFLNDSTIQINEIREINDGKDHFPLLLKRTKLPKSWNKIRGKYASQFEGAGDKVSEFYDAKHLIIGQSIEVFGRDMTLTACDPFTRDFYQRHFNIIQPENHVVNMEKSMHQTSNVSLE